VRSLCPLLLPIDHRTCYITAALGVKDKIRAGAIDRLDGIRCSRKPWVCKAQATMRPGYWVRKTGYDAGAVQEKV
jgi:hypothetical protein